MVHFCQREATLTHPDGSRTVIRSNVWRCPACGVQIAQPESHWTDLAVQGKPLVGPNGR
jgi:hypothetical protein